jgi:glycosyltransferase involved in cell wall biosynthesis
VILPYNATVQIRIALDARKLTDYGIGTYVSHLVRGLGERPDIRLTVLARGVHEPRVTELAPSARVVTVSAAEYGMIEHVRLPAALWRQDVDLVHIPHYVLPLMLMQPAVVTVHDVIQLFYPPRGRALLAQLYLRVMLRSTLRRARRVITVSRASRRDLVHLFGAETAQLDVVPSGVDQRLVRRPADDAIEDLKRRYDLAPPLVLVVANDKPHKNLDFVLRAYHAARRRHRIPGQLVMVGGGERLRDRAAQLGLEDRVRILGRIPTSDLHAVYHTSAVLLHVSLYEGFGLPLVEAMAAGLPVITSNLGAMRELGEGTARLVNPLDLDEVAGAIEQVLVDDPLRRRMIEAGRRRSERLTWQATVDRTVEVYRSALGGGSS